jgi:polyhydroxyalkanoate synthesis regulator phasin
MVESLITPSFAMLFKMFREGKTFAEIVEATEYTPDVVRHARREYEAEWKEPEPVQIRALDKKLQIRELEVDKAMIEKASEERVERLRAQTKRIELEHEVRIERTRATAAGRGR